jgi:serine/threonine protein kinase
VAFETYCPACSKRFPDGIEVCPDDGSPLLRVPEEDLVGKTVDRRYRISEIIGQGGMGIVYRAEHQMLQREVALKVVRRDVVQDETAVKRFLTEARAIATLKNPHTVTIYDSGVTEDGALYYTMELLTGQPLSRPLRREGALDYRRAGDIVAQVCESLEEAHAMGILHRDIKPDNIFLVREKGREFAKLVDFGIAKVLGEASDGPMTRTGMLVGTPRYLSPEQVAGEPVGATTDLYALAVVLYELLTGSPPFSGETPAQIMMMHVQDIPQPVPERNPSVTIPVALDKFIRAALEKDPRKRHQTASEFRQALMGAVADVGAGVAVSTTGPNSLDGSSDSVAVATANTEMDIAQKVIGANAGVDETLAAPGIPERTVTSPLELKDSALPASPVPFALETEETAEVVPVPTAPMQLDPTEGYEQVDSGVVARGRRPWWVLLLGGLGLLVIVPWATGLFGNGEVEPPLVERPVHVEVALPAGVPSSEDVVSEVQRAVELADLPAPATVADSYLPAPDVVMGGPDTTVPTDRVALESRSEIVDVVAEVVDVTGVAEVVDVTGAAEAVDVTGAADIRATAVARKPRVKSAERVDSHKSRASGSEAKDGGESSGKEKAKEPVTDDWFDDVEKLPTK